MNHMNISINDVASQWADISYCENNILDFLRSGNYMSDEPIQKFEHAYADYIDTDYAVGVSNGTDALHLCYEVLKKDKTLLILQANTFISDAISAAEDITIRLVDCDMYYQMNTDLLQERLAYCRNKYDTIIVCITHMYGHPANIPVIMKLCEEYNAYLVEDCSHAQGASVLEGRVGSFGMVNPASLYPGKNLGAAGEAGIITTNSQLADNHLRLLRNIGSRQKYVHEIKGTNSRMDAIQAIILKEKLTLLDKWNTIRKHISMIYAKELDREHLILPEEAPWCNECVYYTYTIRTKHRNALKEYLHFKGIDTNIYWPYPIQKTKMYSELNVGNFKTLIYASENLSLPIHPYLNEDSLSYIIKCVNSFFSEKIYENSN